MRSEIESLHTHKTWVHVKRSSVQKSSVITNKWVFTVKHKQQYGLNYNETFAPVVRFETIRTAIYYAL